ncbi:Fic family protein [Actinomycetes bacterium M1A6_2h]
MDAATAVRSALASARLEGWNPTPDDVTPLLALAEGSIAFEHFADRTVADVGGRTGTRRPFGALRRAGYTVPGTTVLRNRFGIVDPDVAGRVEFALAAGRTCELHLGRCAAVPRTARGLLDTHRHLFDDMYTWAGSVRTVQLSKNGTKFAPVGRIAEYFDEINALVDGARWADLDHGPMTYVCSALYAVMNHAHPFRDGNGRAGRAFLCELLRDTEFHLDYSRTDRTEWVAASIDSAPLRPHGTPSPRPFLPVFRAVVQPRS